MNDHAPLIVFNTLSAANAAVAHVNENSVSGSFVAHVTASDADSGVNARVTCVLADSELAGAFELVPRPHQLQEADYQLMTSRRRSVLIDREARWRFNVTVSCSDRGRPHPLTSHSTTIIITTTTTITTTITTSISSISTHQSQVADCLRRRQQRQPTRLHRAGLHTFHHCPAA